MMLCALSATAKTVCTVEGNSVKIENVGGRLDKGTFHFKGKAIRLKIPKATNQGLPAGAKVRLERIDFGYTPKMWGDGYAHHLVLMCSEDGGDRVVSQAAELDGGSFMTGSDNSRVMRVVYRFDKNAEFVAGEKYRLAFMGEDGLELERVRYAVTIIDDGKSLFEGLPFLGRDRVNNYGPVFSIRMSILAMPDATEAAAATPAPGAPKAEAPTEVESPALAKAVKAEAPKPARKLPETPKDHTIGLTVGRPKKLERKEQDEDDSYKYEWFSRDVELKSSIYQYSGKISCQVPKNEKTEVTVEAYFVVRDIGKGAKDRVNWKKTLGKFEFGENLPASQPLAFESPAVGEVKVRRAYQGFRSGASKSERSGVRYQGVVVRALENGKVAKVISIPSNRSWEQLAKADRVEIVPDDEESGAKFGIARKEERLYDRIEGTGESTPPGWLDDFYAAQQKAKDEDKLLLVVFCGSDWCGPCRRLTERVLQKARFLDEITPAYVPVFIDSPQNQNLLSEKCRSQNSTISRMIRGGEGGVPSVNIVSAAGERLVNLGAATHLENGVESYLEYFAAVDDGLKKVQAVKARFPTTERKSPEYLAAMHEALSSMDGEALLACFRKEATRLFDADKEYLKLYPYFNVVQPLEQEAQKIAGEIETKARQSMSKDNVPYSYDKYRDYWRKAFEECDGLKKLQSVLDRIAEQERQLGDRTAKSQLEALRVRIFGWINSD